MMDAHHLVGDFVAENFERAALFEKLGIDFCCGGKRLLKDVCKEKGLDVDVVLKKIEEWDQQDSFSNPALLPPSELCDHIEQVHHRYLKERLPFIQNLIQKIVISHGNEYLPLLERFTRFVKDLMSHMEEEEHQIFPSIRKRLNIQEKFSHLVKEHEVAGEDLSFFREFTNDYSVPKNACVTHRTAILELEKLEKDMHLHVYKENHLLFLPGSIE